MITSKFSKNNHMCILLLLLTVHIIKGTIVHSTEGDGYIDDDSFILKFDITPSFTGTAIIAQDGTTRTTCFPTTCSPTGHNDVSFNQSGTEIILTFSPVSISHQGSWQCSNNGEVSTYPFAPQQRPSSGGDKEGTEGWKIGVAVAASCVAVLILVIGVVYVCKDRFRLILRVNSIQNINNKAEIEKSVVIKKDDTQDITDALPERNLSNYGLWKHNGATLFNTNIKNASIKDVGLYESNIKGGGMVNIQLIVLGTENTVYVQKGNEAFLGIDQENATAKWTHNGKPLTTKEMRRTRINIQNALPKNTGLYVCTLSQSNKSFEHQLIVIDEALIDDHPSLKQYMATLSQ